MNAPLDYETAQLRDRLAVRAHALDVQHSGGQTYASTLAWWGSIIENTPREIKTVNFTALLALPNTALFGRLIVMRRDWTQHLLARVNAQKPGEQANV